MPWIAQLTVVKKTKNHELDPSDEPGRYRRGEVVDVHTVSELPTGQTFDHNTFVYVFVTDIPDTRTEDKLKEKLLVWHTRTDQGQLELDNIVGTFEDTDTLSEPGGATADVDVVKPRSLVVSNWSGSKPAVGTVITGTPSGATGEFQSFEGIFLTRKRLRIPVKDIPSGHRTRLQNDGWTDASWSQVTNFFKRYADNTSPTTTRGVGGPSITNAMENAQDDAGVTEDITS